MKILMKALLLAAAVYGYSAAAAPFVCITDIKSSQLEWPSETDEAQFQLASWPGCRAMSNLAAGLNASAITLQGFAIYSACTGVGAPATVWLEGAGIGTQMLSLVVGQLPCDNTVEEKQIKKLATEAICEELEKDGITCSRNL